mmetsp:Transcript_39389/g.51919  ORF Transcript_39389/g.51919 Transcript_39389/m.51919 type:complete len:240 (-) Transcript_39389:42-761(-)
MNTAPPSLKKRKTPTSSPKEEVKESDGTNQMMSAQTKNICALCNSSPSNKGTILCGHAFCFHCISQHAEQWKACPICSKPFTYIRLRGRPIPWGILTMEEAAERQHFLLQQYYEGMLQFESKVIDCLQIYSILDKMSSRHEQINELRKNTAAKAEQILVEGASYRPELRYWNPDQLLQLHELISSDVMLDLDQVESVAYKKFYENSKAHDEVDSQPMNSSITQNQYEAKESIEKNAAYI